MQQPIEVVVEEDEQIVEWVAAVDVAKASGMVCTRVPHESVPGKRVTKVGQVSSTTRALVELGDHLRCQGIERVVVESTSDYWRPFYYLLEAAGLVVWLSTQRKPKTSRVARRRTRSTRCG
jgi:transposase